MKKGICVHHMFGNHHDRIQESNSIIITTLWGNQNFQLSNKILKQSLEEINLQNHIIQRTIPSTTETTKQHISKATLMCYDVSVLMMSWFLFQRSANVSLTSFL